MTLEHYERGAAHVLKSYHDALVGPHASTTRWSYTVPTGKYAYLNSVFVYMMRDGAPTTASYADARVLVTSGANSAYVVWVTQLQGTSGVSTQGSASDVGVFLPGTVISAETVDSSTGGTYLYTAEGIFTEFA